MIRPLTLILSITVVAGIMYSFTLSTGFLGEIAKIDTNCDIMNGPRQALASTTHSDATESHTFYQYNICIVVLSRADGVESRSCQRKICRPIYNSHTSSTNIRHVFVAGIPHYDNRSYTRHVQGQHALEQEIRLALDMLAEHDEFGDVIVAPHRDVYRDLSEKSLAVLKFGVENKCKYTLKIDDEYCVNIDNTLAFLDKYELNEAEEELYFGHSSFLGTEYPRQMSGPFGDYAHYMSGWLYGVSYKLASLIVTQDWTHSVLHHAYGTSSEDVNMGLWVKHAIKMHNISVKYEADASYLQPIPEGACNVSNDGTV